MIFGIANPKIVDSSNNDIDLDYSVVTKDEPEYRQVLNESKISGDRSFYHKGYHWAIDMRYHLFKEGDPETKFTTLNGLLGQEVTMYRHKDKDPFSDANGDIVPFILTECRRFYLQTVDYQDGLLLKFISTKFVDLEQSLNATLVDELNSEAITTEDGQGIILG